MKQTGLTPEQYERLTKVYPPNGKDIQAIIKLLSARSLRTPFKASVANQIRSWLNDPRPKFRTPITTKQMDYIR